MKSLSPAPRRGPRGRHFESVLQGTHLSIYITEEKELAADALQKKLHKRTNPPPARCGG